MTAIIIPFPARAPTWPDGQLGVELERLAVLLQKAGNRQPGKYVSLAQARAAALAAYQQRAQP